MYGGITIQTQLHTLGVVAVPPDSQGRTSGLFLKVSISVPLHAVSTKVSRSAHCKPNSSLLQDEKVKSHVESLIMPFWNKAQLEDSYCSKWE